MDDDHDDKRRRIKTRHLKKREGDPFLRRDISYDFLHCLFLNSIPCFSHNGTKVPFSTLYTSSISTSSKCSKILKDRLSKDPAMSLSVAKVCLLVNSGRLNTTINFVPEMKLTLRTYHSIPSLQILSLGMTIQLQDTPRLKLILKAVVDDNPQVTLDELLGRYGVGGGVGAAMGAILGAAVPGAPGFSAGAIGGSIGDSANFADPANSANLTPTTSTTSGAPTFAAPNIINPESANFADPVNSNPVFANSTSSGSTSFPNPTISSSSGTTFTNPHSSNSNEFSTNFADPSNNHAPEIPINNLLNEPTTSNLHQFPNTTVINLIFLLSNYPYTIPFFDGVGNTFMDFFLEPEFDPMNKAQRFLWLLYTYLETDFSPEMIAKNPFGPILPKPIEVNPDIYDIDQDYEIEYAEKMQHIRRNYLENELNQHNVEFNSSDSSLKKKSPRKKKVESLPEVTSGPISTNYMEAPISLINHLKPVDSLQFPIPLMNALFDTYYPNSEPNPNDELSYNNHQLQTSLIRPFIHDVRTSSKASTASFNKKTHTLGNWIYRYFKYKRSVDNKLLGMEWEDIKYDLQNGIENSLYKQFGRSLLFNSTPIIQDLEDGFIEDLSYLPIHEFNKSNERNMFEMQLMNFCNTWFINALNERDLNSEIKISIDLENELISID